MSEHQSMGVPEFERAAEGIKTLSPAVLELLQRQTIAFLYAIGRAQGVEYRVVRVKNLENEEANERQSV